MQKNPLFLKKRGNLQPVIFPSGIVAMDGTYQPVYQIWCIAITIIF
jgi:hypothetical protein